MVISSHDMEFLESIATSIIELRNGEIKEVKDLC